MAEKPPIKVEEDRSPADRFHFDPVAVGIVLDRVEEGGADPIAVAWLRHQIAGAAEIRRMLELGLGYFSEGIGPSGILRFGREAPPPPIVATTGGELSPLRSGLRHWFQPPDVPKPGGDDRRRRPSRGRGKRNGLRKGRGGDAATRLTAHELARVLLAGPDVPVVREYGFDEPRSWKQVVFVEQITLPGIADSCPDPEAINHVFFGEFGALPPRLLIRLD